jgi:hypothetical protein
MSHEDGVIVSVKTQFFSQSTAMENRSTLTSNPSLTTPSSTSPQTQISEVNAVQYAPSQQTGGKKNTKNKKNNNNNNEPPKAQNPPPVNEKKPQRKLKFPCLICSDDHYTQERPHHNEVAKHFKGNSQPAMITRPFPQQQSMVAQTPSLGGSSNHPSHDEALTSSHIYMFNDIDLTTRSKT